MSRMLGSATALALVLLAFTFHANSRLRTVSNEPLFAILRDSSAPDVESSAPVRFDGHQVWRVALATATDVSRIDVLRTQVPTLDFWTDPRIGRHGVDVRVSGDKAAQDALAEYLTKFKLSYDVYIPDVQDAIDSQLKQPISRDALSKQHPLTSQSDLDDSYFSKYHTMAEISAYLDSLVASHPHIVEKFSIGETFEGRKQWGVKLRAPSTVKKSKKEFVFFGGHHAREWIGPAVVQYILAELVTKYGSDPQLTAALDAFDFTIIPVLNVDGYEYTHTTNRMWRKNRQPNAGNLCVGTDPNRNWDNNWGGEGSTSRNPCSDSYVGSAPFSAPEPRNLAEYLRAREPGSIVSLVDFHAYSQLWMYPYGSDCTKTATPAVAQAATRAASALKKVHGKSFSVGSICNIIYQASGSSADWAYDTVNATFSYGVELRDQGLYGFLLPPKQIVPSGEETLAGVLALVEFVEGWEKGE